MEALFLDDSLWPKFGRYAALLEMQPTGLNSLSSAYAETVQRPSGCVPDATVVTTFVNQHQLEHLRLQAATLPRCFKARYLALCSLKSRHEAMGAPPSFCMPWGASESSGWETTPTRPFTMVTRVRA